MKKLTILILLFFTLGSASAWNPFKAQTYQECILENMKGVKSDDAASQIQVACIMKTSKGSSGDSKNCVKRKLTSEEKKLVNSTAVVESYGFLKVKLYNGNKNISIKSVKVEIIDLEAKRLFEFELSNSYVPPISTSGEMLAELLYAPKKWDYHITEIITEQCK